MTTIAGEQLPSLSKKETERKWVIKYQKDQQESDRSEEERQASEVDRHSKWANQEGERISPILESKQKPWDLDTNWGSACKCNWEVKLLID